MYKGIARLVGMDVVDAGNLEGLLRRFLEVDEYDFFYVHVKYTDSYGEDGNYDAKKEVIEKADSLMPKVLELNPDVLVITSDHSTLCQLKPFLASSAGAAF